jgi:hypothetical protein
MAEQWIIDPVAEDASNVPLDLLAAPFNAVRFNTPTPGIDPRWAQPADADGDRLASMRYLNREIAGSIEIVPAAGARAASDARTALGRLADKVAKVNREGGTLRRELPSGEVVTFDLLTADPIDPSWDVDWDAASIVRVELRCTAMPFARGAEQVRTARSERTLPMLVFTETSIPGDVPALGRLVVTDTQAVSQSWCVWGLQSSTYDAASTAALFYEAEALTPLGTAAVATVSGASGGASRNALTEGSLTSEWTALLSTRALGGAHLTHVGEYRVFARIQRPATNAGAVGVALEWALGDFRAFTRNEATTYAPGEFEEAWTIVDLGVVAIPVDTPQWEGRLIARTSSDGDDLSVDALWLVPTERSGEAAGVAATVAAPTTLSARDPFEGSAEGALSGQSLPVGGRWSGAGDGDDFTIPGGGGGGD